MSGFLLFVQSTGRTEIDVFDVNLKFSKKNEGTEQASTARKQRFSIKILNGFLA